MSFRIRDTFVICVEEPDTCERCGAREELRPYGPNGQRVCFKCGTSPELRETVKANMGRAMSGVGLALKVPRSRSTKRGGGSR